MRGEIPLCASLTPSFETQTRTSSLVHISLMPFPLCYMIIVCSSLPMSGPRRPGSFKFVIFWTSLTSFCEFVSQAWSKPSGHLDKLFYGLKITTKKLSTWSCRLFSKTKVLLHATLIVIIHLVIAQERFSLSDMSQTYP
jgi:hypothetical protein